MKLKNIEREIQKNNETVQVENMFQTNACPI